MSSHWTLTIIVFPHFLLVALKKHKTIIILLLLYPITNTQNDPKASYENETPIFGSPEQAAQKAINFYSSLLTEDGHWAGDYGGPMFLLPGLIILLYIAGSVLPDPYYKEMIRYIFSKQTDEGGYGLHIEGKATIFGTVLNYVALRLLGISKDDARMKKTIAFLKKEGGIAGLPQWGKLYMCALGVMEYDCIDPVPPELWLLPNWFPLVQPGKWWCHCRVVYLPMSYIYGTKSSMPKNDLTRSLRDELFFGEYDKIDWNKYRSYVHPRDNYNPATWIYKIFSWVLDKYEKYCCIGWLRKWANDNCMDHIKHEDDTTNHIDIGPVNKVLNMMSIYFAEGAESERYKKHFDRLFDYLWLSDDGMKMQGYNGSQLWDTAFAIQAIIDSGKADTVQETVKQVYDFIDYTQVKDDVDNLEKYHRHISKGGWPFSTLDHGWPITDCTAEGMKAVLAIESLPFMEGKRIADQRLFDAVNVLLSMHNKGGGWATYELTRTHPIIEVINPAALYGEIMIDYQHTECTSASITALKAFQKRFPDHRKSEIDAACADGLKLIKSKMSKEGGWYGGWAVCYCYAGWFAMCAMKAMGETYETSYHMKQGCRFLIEKQLPDGGWGESYLSNVEKRYVQNHRSQVVNTSWVLLALMAADYPDRAPIDRGIELLLRRQMPNGDFPQENISGVFNHNCMITYTNYRNLFPIWALGVYNQKYKNM